LDAHDKVSGGRVKSATEALAALVGAATLVAVTVTVWAALMAAGAVYRPVLVIVPTLGLIDHVTAVFPEPPVTLAVNCWEWEAERLAVAGVTDTDTGASRVTDALADLVGSAALVAVTVTVWAKAIAAGAVYRPVLVMVPTLGLMDHVTAVFPAPPVTLAVNCCDWADERLAVAGAAETDTGATKEIVPGWIVMGILLPSAPTAYAFWGSTVRVPDAVNDRFSVSIATVPSGISFVFIPERRHRFTAHARVLPVDVAEAPGWVLPKVTPKGAIRSHCRATGRLPPMDATPRATLMLLPGIAATEETCSVVWAPAKLPKRKQIV
jgi:hypothetical protein